MKHRIYKRYKKGKHGGQRYWVSRKIHSSFPYPKRKINPEFYHISNKRIDSPILQPKGYYEKVDIIDNKPNLDVESYADEDYPYNEFTQSETPESSFSKSIKGALIGEISGEPAKEGEYFVYSTKESPDYDLSKEMPHSMDFGVVEEVRYRKPVKIKLLGKLNVSQKDIDLIHSGYGGHFYPENIRKIKKELKLNLRK